MTTLIVTSTDIMGNGEYRRFARVFSELVS